ncbi:MAG: GNAT family N-acetyltransferase [Candidatus Omnitrophica bacterium]|nr:GNAT family N-acetyltransferase [Candidatus Omnitrophota bacterium]MCM8810962.1 GNAT family N-acetyltransferase [Candidatus Omnitrophota bacterium]
MVIRNPVREEYDRIIRFLEDAYGHFYNFFPIIYPQSWTQENTDFSNILIIEENGKICSLVRIFPINLIHNDIKIKIAGIGNVATEFEERGKGFMTILLNQAIKKMEKEGYSLSILWGDRHRYINFGYENAGKIINTTITQRGLEKLRVNSVSAKKYLGEKEILLKIIDTYNKKNYRIERDEKYFSEIYKKLFICLYYFDQSNKFSYVVVNEQGTETKVYEFAGEPETILGILKYLSERFGKNKFYLEFPNFYEIPEIILKATSSWSCSTTGMVKIISLKKTIETFLPLIEKEFPENKEIMFEIEGKEKVGIKKEDGKIKFIDESSHLIKLKEEEMVRLFFNFSDDFLKIDKDLRDICKTFLPFDLFFPTIDHI